VTFRVKLKVKHFGKLQCRLAAKRSEIHKVLAWKAIGKVYAANRMHQLDLTYDDLEGHFKVIAISNCNNSGAVRPISMNFLLFASTQRALHCGRMASGYSVTFRVKLKVKDFGKLQSRLAAKRSEIHTGLTWKAIGKVYAANRMHQLDLTYDDLKGHFKVIAISDCNNSGTTCPIWMSFFSFTRLDVDYILAEWRMHNL
jgi:hypothetical protein